MLSKTSKILLGIYAFLLLIILLTFSDSFGFFLLVGTGLFTLVTSIFVANDVKKLKNSLTSRIFSVVLISLILYSAIMLFYGLGHIGVGDKGLVFIFSLFAMLVFAGLSLVICIILVVINKTQNIENKPNKILSIILIVLLTLLLYSSTVSGVARLTGSSGFCSMHIEMKSNSFIFVKSMQDSCIFRVALDNSNVAQCNQIKDSYVDVANSKKERCIEAIAFKENDEDICAQLTYDSEKDFCYSIIARNKQDSEICDYILDNEELYWCYSLIARDKKR